MELRITEVGWQGTFWIQKLHFYTSKVLNICSSLFIPRTSRTKCGCPPDRFRLGYHLRYGGDPTSETAEFAVWGFFREIHIWCGACFLAFQAFTCDIAGICMSRSLTIGAHTSSNVVDICRHVRVFVTKKQWMRWLITGANYGQILVLGSSVALLVFDEKSIRVIR